MLNNAKMLRGDSEYAKEVNILRNNSNIFNNTNINQDGQYNYEPNFFVQIWKLK